MVDRGFESFGGCEREGGEVGRGMVRDGNRVEDVIFESSESSLNSFIQQSPILVLLCLSLQRSMWDSIYLVLILFLVVVVRAQV